MAKEQNNIPNAHSRTNIAQSKTQYTSNGAAHHGTHPRLRATRGGAKQGDDSSSGAGGSTGHHDRQRPSLQLHVLGTLTNHCTDFSPPRGAEFGL